MGKVKNELNNNLTIPNVISFIRIVLIVPFVVFFLCEEYIYAGITILLSGLSDCVDGTIARKFHMESELGKILDPLADKITLLVVGICLIIIEPYVLTVMVVLILKDLIMLIGGASLIKNGHIPPHSKWYGKLGTVLFYISVSVIVILKIIDRENAFISMLLLSVTAAEMLFTLFMYYRIYIRIMKQPKESKGDNL